MTTDPELPGTPRCGNPSRQLLDFYLNGSLETQEEETVRAHLAACPTCSVEADEMASIVRGLQGHGINVSSGRARRTPLFWVVGLAACAVALLGMAFYWNQRQGHSGRPGQGAIRLEVPLVLGAGAPRGDRSAASVDLPRTAGTLRISLLPPVTPGAAYSASLTREDVVLTADAPLGPLDPMGRGEVTFPTAALDAAGRYELRLRVVAPDGAVRTFRYPFDVRHTADGR